MGGKGLSITTKPTWKQHGAFRFPAETESKTDGCVNEMALKPFEGPHKSCASFPQG